MMRTTTFEQLNGGSVANKQNLKLSEQEWEQLFQFAKCKTYKRDEPILSQGEQIKRIYQLSEGTCRVEVWSDHNKTPIGKMTPYSLFGEITYMFGGGAAVSIVADSDRVVVYTIEKSGRYIYSFCVILCQKKLFVITDFILQN